LCEGLGAGCFEYLGGVKVTDVQPARMSMIVPRYKYVVALSMDTITAWQNDHSDQSLASLLLQCKREREDGWSVP
jgi:hypothetical protein